MFGKCKLKALTALTIVACLSGCTSDADFSKTLQEQMHWNSSRKAELGISDSVSSKTSASDRRGIFGGFYGDIFGF